MHLNELKLSFFKHHTQITVFDLRGKILDSCHSLFDLSGSLHGSIYELDPVLASLSEPIVHLQAGQCPIMLPCVANHLDTRELFLDYYIYSHPENPELRLCMLIDQTAIYLQLREVQQERNELLLHRR